MLNGMAAKGAANMEPQRRSTRQIHQRFSTGLE